MTRQNLEELKQNEIALYDYGDGPTGFENLQTSDYLTPILDVVQGNSAEVVKRTIKGLKAGDLIIRSLGLHFDGETGVEFVVAGSQTAFLEWVPKEDGKTGGLKGVHSPDLKWVQEEKEKQKFGKIRLSNGNDLVETKYLFGILTTPDGDQIRCVVPFASTKINQFRALMTKADGLTVTNASGKPQRLPLYAVRYRLKTLLKERDGQAFYIYDQIGFNGPNLKASLLPPQEDLFQTAKTFATQIVEGSAKVDTSTATDEAEPARQTTSAGGQTLDEEIPF